MSAEKLVKGTFPSAKVARPSQGRGVTHRPSPIVEFENVYVLASGQIKASGRLGSTYPKADQELRLGDPIAGR